MSFGRIRHRVGQYGLMEYNFSTTVVKLAFNGKTIFQNFIKFDVESPHSVHSRWI